jgi:hypothetical protein
MFYNISVNESLDNINKTLETQFKRQNEIMQQMLDIMPRPASKFIRIMETFVLFISVFGIISLIDIIIKWFLGG